MDVSIIVPLYHGTKYIKNLLQMIRRNIESAGTINVELVLVNDSPEDEPEDSDIQDADFPILLIRNKENLGIQRARLCGAEHSHGRYLLFLDQDDVILDDAIRKLYDAVQSGDIAVSDWLLEVSGKHGIDSQEVLANTKCYSVKRFSCGGNVIGPPGHCMLRRDCLPSCWRNRIMRINGADDYLLWIGMLAEKRKFIRCEGKLYIHKYHDGCFSNDELNIWKSEEEAFQLAADEYEISAFWRRIHARFIRWRIRCATIMNQQSSLFTRWVMLLLCPEQLLLRILEKCGIYV